MSAVSARWTRAGTSRRDVPTLFAGFPQFFFDAFALGSERYGIDFCDGTGLVLCNETPMVVFNLVKRDHNDS